MSKEPVERQPVDIYTFQHFIAGIVLRKLGISANNALAINVLWEMFEAPLIRKWRGRPHWESPINSIIDIIATYIGYNLS